MFPLIGLRFDRQVMGRNEQVLQLSGQRVTEVWVGFCCEQCFDEQSGRYRREDKRNARLIECCGHSAVIDIEKSVSIEPIVVSDSLVAFRLHLRPFAIRQKH